jgi:hypothetical protein
MLIEQRGQWLASVPVITCRSDLAPQCEQCLLPRNIMPKHEGQATVARRDLQNSHDVELAGAAAPQLGQLSDSACMKRRC